MPVTHGRGRQHGLRREATNEPKGALDTLTYEVKGLLHISQQFNGNRETESCNDASQVGDVVEGTVGTIQPYGAFVALKDNLNGLLHISQISHDRISSVEQVLSPGQKLKVGRPPS